MMGQPELIDTAEKSWREHVAAAAEHADQLPQAIQTGREVLHLAHAVYHLAKALEGIVAGDPQVSRWKPMEQLQPAPDPDTSA